MYKCIELTVEINGGDSENPFFCGVGESLGSQWTSIVLQEWESDQNGMVMDIGQGESAFFTYFPDVINEGPLSRTLSSIAIVNFLVLMLYIILIKKINSTRFRKYQKDFNLCCI